MDAIIDFISAHPAIAGLSVALIIILFLHFTFKNLVKFVLIILVILMILFGINSFKGKDTLNGEPKESTKLTQSVIDDIKFKMSHMIKDMKDLYRKSKTAPKEVDKLLDSSDKQLDKEFKKK